MKSKNIFKNMNKIASALMAIAAGLLTDLLYDSLTEEYFEGQLIDCTIQINKIAEYTALEKICIIVSLFLSLWIILSYGIPLMIYCVNTLRYHNIPKFRREKVLKTYEECKNAILDLRKQVLDPIEEKDNVYVVIFKETCLLIVKLHKVFCSGKLQNEIVVRNSFRIGCTVNDIDIKISIYEYLAIIGIIQQTIELSQSKAPIKLTEHLNNDYNNILNYLEELEKLPVHLNLTLSSNNSINNRNQTD